MNFGRWRCAPNCGIERKQNEQRHKGEFGEMEENPVWPRQRMSMWGRTANVKGRLPSRWGRLGKALRKPC